MEPRLKLELLLLITEHHYRTVSDLVDFNITFLLTMTSDINPRPF